MAIHEVAESEKVGKKGGDRLHCMVVSPERVQFDEIVDFVALPLDDGELGVLPGRLPLIGRLGYGELRTRAGGATRRYFIDGGFAQVRDDVVTVLTSRAILAERIDTAAAARELEQAKEHHALNEVDQAEKNKVIARARAQIRVASAKG